MTFNYYLILQIVFMTFNFNYLIISNLSMTFNYYLIIQVISVTFNFNYLTLSNLSVILYCKKYHNFDCEFIISKTYLQFN